MTSSIASAFPPHVLREYALIADGERGALVGPRGDIAWMCAPRWHDDAVFATLLGVESVFAVTPTGRYVWGGRYEDGTLIWHNRWVTGTGIVECRDALALPGKTDRAVILRRIMAVSGPSSLHVVLAPRAEFDRFGLSRLSQHDGVWTGRCGPLQLRWSGAADARTAARGRLDLDVTLGEGQHRDLVLEVSSGSLDDGPPPEPDVAWESTEHGWQEVVPEMDVTVAADDARQSYALLRGMTSATGGMVAAATMSLPERAAEGRNYDYRYAWIRDQCYAGQAIAACGALPLLDSAVRFVTERVLDDGPDLAPAYTVTGGAVPDERHLDLPGYPGGKSIVGNWVNGQFQLDNLGEILLLLAAAARRDRLDLDNWRAAEVAVAAVRSRWGESDAGIWELDNRRWAHSRLICAAGLRAVGAVAPASQGSEWSALADSIVADAARDCLHPSGRWQRSPDDDRIDASLLLPGIRGAVSVTDPRTVATVEAVRHELGREGYVYRFSHDARPLAEAEGAFVLCGFHLTMALQQQGEHLEAVRRFERNRAACGAPGLFTEEYDVEQRQLRGNYPQAFVHALLIESAKRLAEPSGEAMT